MSVQYSFMRYEKKYFLDLRQYELLLGPMERYMKKDAYGQYTICNVYYDTEDWRLVRASIEKPPYKEKLRVRSYGTPNDHDSVFIELKKKYDGIVYKRRISLPAKDAGAFLAGEDVSEDAGQIGKEIRWFQDFYHAVPRVFLAYDRKAFAGIENEDIRITFDTNLRWRDSQVDLRKGDWGAPLIPKDNVLMEIKTAGGYPLWLSRLLADICAFPNSFSKYGTCYQKFIIPKETMKGARFSA